MSKKMKFTAVGDARCFNYETTINEVGKCCASQFSGGSYLRADKKTLDTMKEYGFHDLDS